MSALLGTYIHHLSPFAIRFSESFGLRWYGLAYVAAFVVAFFLLRWFVRLGACELREDKVADFITLCAFVGVMLGGRLGFMLLYNFDEFRSNPLSFFNFLGGGMASHGGIAGLILVTLFYSRWKKISWTGLGDNLVTVAPIGLFFGRLANFVNGELYGRETSHRLAMKFPEELRESVTRDGIWSGWRYPEAMLVELAEKAKDIAPGLSERVSDAAAVAASKGLSAHQAIVTELIETSRDNPAFRERLGEILTLRHPSQLYQALCEGLLLFVVLLVIRLRWKNLYHGVLTGIFFIGYAVARIGIENLREPDAERILGLTRGQFYSTFMIGIGAAFLVWGIVRKRTNRLPTSG
ncbi:MAG: prolipoprotein diacylglyceryl transferase [Verrucomicrobiota bacterium]